jgi:hypothetical protein
VLSLLTIYAFFSVVRFVVRIGLGGGHVFSSWFLEFVPAKHRGWMFMFFFFWTVGEAVTWFDCDESLTWRGLNSNPRCFCFCFSLHLVRSENHVCLSRGV